MAVRVVLIVSILLVSAALFAKANSLSRSDELYKGWMQMYDLRFEDAHQTFRSWREMHPDDPLGPASDAAAYLFAELARLEVLESELFVDDDRFAIRKKVVPDPQVKLRFTERINDADRLADAHLKQSSTDADAIFVKSLTFGLHADYAALLDKQNLKALACTRKGKPYGDQLLAVDPQAFDAYLGPGVQNYVFSLKSAPVRFFLRLTGTQVDRQKGIEQLRKTALHGYYLEPFAKLLLAVAALRDNQKDEARKILTELHSRFPNNQLYGRELARLGPATPPPASSPNDSK